jgi:hypothetical protein
MEDYFRDLFDAYFSDEISLKEFNEEFIPATWDGREQWMSGVLLRYYEYTSGHWTKEELKAKMREVLAAETDYGKV